MEQIDWHVLGNQRISSDETTFITNIIHVMKHL